MFFFRQKNAVRTLFFYKKLKKYFQSLPEAEQSIDFPKTLINFERLR